MSTRGSIAIRRQRYRRQRDPRERPEAVRHPRVADHVGLHGEHERGGERGGERRGAGADERDEKREPPGRPQERTEEPCLGALLGVPVRDAVCPAFPSPYPCGWCTTVRTPSRRLIQ